MHHHGVAQVAAKEKRMSRGITSRIRIAARATAWLALAALMLSAQSTRDAYRSAFRAWREADTSLERDAATGGETVGARADRVAIEAAKYSAERRAFLDRFILENEQKLAWLETPVEAVPAIPAGETESIAAQSTAVRRGIDTLANDPDQGIQQVRSMLERENVALRALSAAVAARQKAADQVDITTAAIDPPRLKALDMSHAFMAGMKKASDETGAEALAWVEYYRKLADGARATPPSAPVTPVATPAAEPAPRTTITPLPLPRYTGDWIYAPNGLYHGTQPESVDLVVREDNGYCQGTVEGKFVLPRGSTLDPQLRFTFSGAFQNTVRQTFPLETSDGAKGTIDLIPGGAFNLIEINIEIEAKPGKVRQANLVLIKK
jgi:hypothetical protein